MNEKKPRSYRRPALALGVMSTLVLLRVAPGCYTVNVNIDTAHPDGSSSATIDLSSPAMNGVPDMMAPLPDMTAPLPDMTPPLPDMAVKPPDMTAPLPDMTAPPPDMTAPLPDMTPPGPIYRLVNGDYRTTAVSGIVDGCGSGLTAAALMTNRTLYNDLSTGGITLTSTPSGTLLGSGPVRYNSGTLTANLVLSDGVCRWSSQRSTQLTVTADNTFTMVLTDTRSSFMSEAGGPGCTLSGTCQVMFTANMTYP